jgi:CyaY protein
VADADDDAGAWAVDGSVSGPFWPQAPTTAAASAKTTAAAGARRVATLTATLFELMRGILVSTSSGPLGSSGPATARRVALSDADYHREAGALLARIEAACDRWLQDDVIDIDTHRTGGLLELMFPDRSKIVVNTQPPLHEMWVAAKAGGFHYQWDGQCWRDTRDGHELVEMLSRQASAQGGKALRF